MRLKKEFYIQDGITLGKALLGKILVRNVDGKTIQARIVETESYMGPDDRACHAYNNKRTPRTQTMFREGGCAYVYLIYGMYHCLNIVAHKKDQPEAVLIRAVQPLNEIGFLRDTRGIKSKKDVDLTNGPGKLCKALLIDQSLNGYDLVNGQDLYLLDDKKKVEYIKRKRINIDYAKEYKDKLWRFYIKENPYVSKK